MIGRVNTGGGGSGGTLVVSAPVGVTVIAEKDGKTYKRTANANGIATFKGLATGVWSLRITDGVTTSTPVSVEVNADYEITLAFFSATIVVTYPANSTCTCSDGTTTFTDTNSADAEKTVTFAVPNAGVWTVTSTANDGSGDSASETVEITSEGQSESVELSYEYIIFDYGKTANYTGGWATSTSRYKQVYQQSSGYAPSVSTNSDGSLTIAISGQGGKSGIYYTNSKIDVTKYSALYFNGSSSGGSTDHLYLGVTNSLLEFVQSHAIAEKQLIANTYNDNIIDLSSISGSFYIVFGVYNNNSAIMKQLKLVP